MKLLKALAVAVAVLSSLCCRSQDGSTAYNFLNVTSSARIYGLGGMNITLVDDDITVTDQNPALLGSEMDNMVSLNYMRYLGGSNFAGLRYGHSAGEHGAWAATMQYFGYGSMKESLPDGTVTGSFSPKDVVFGALYSHDITDRLRGGIAVKMIYSGYADYSAFALATDLGLNYYDPERDMSLSIVGANLGGQVKRFNEAYDRLPIDVRLGWSQSFGDFPFRLSVTAWNLTKWHLPYYETGDGSDGSSPEIKDSFGSNLMRHLVFAAEIVPDSRFHVGIGYNYKTRTDMATYSRNVLSGFSVGAGMSLGGFGVDAAFAMPHRGASTLMLNFSADIGRFL